MTFTDDDLKWLKGCPVIHSQCPLCDLDMDALLARLEASERVCEMAWGCHSGEIDSSELYMGPYFKAWRKAAGKS